MCPVHCAEQFLELKICISPQFRAIDPPNPAGGFIQQNENVRFATAACMQKYGNVRFATVACAKCMRYGGRGGGPYHGGGGGWQHGTRNHIYIYIFFNICVYVFYGTKFVSGSFWIQAAVAPKMAAWCTLEQFPSDLPCPYAPCMVLGCVNLHVT